LVVTNLKRNIENIEENTENEGDETLKRRKIEKKN